MDREIPLRDDSEVRHRSGRLLYRSHTSRYPNRCPAGGCKRKKTGRSPKRNSIRTCTYVVETRRNVFLKSRNQEWISKRLGILVCWLGKRERHVTHERDFVLSAIYKLSDLARKCDFTNASRNVRDILIMNMKDRTASGNDRIQQKRRRKYIRLLHRGDRAYKSNTGKPAASAPYINIKQELIGNVIFPKPRARRTRKQTRDVEP